jgi:GNAT superfamily N-acetyltransferase
VAGVGSAFGIRRARAGDARSLAALGAHLFEQSFGAANSPEDMRAYVSTAFDEGRQRSDLEDPSMRVWLAEARGGEAIGYAQIRLGAALPAGVTMPSARPVELVRLYADRAWHGRGVGEALLGTCIDATTAWGADILWLGVWEKNPRAIAFYAKHDFRRVWQQPFLLGADRQTDWVMLRVLTRP